MRTRRHRAIAKARREMEIHEFNKVEQQLLNAGFVKTGVRTGRITCQDSALRNPDERRTIMGVDWGSKGGDKAVITRARVGSKDISIEDVHVYE